MAKINLHLKEPNFDPAKALAYEPLKLSNLEPRVTFESKIGDHSRSIPTGSTLKIVDKHQQLSTLKATIQKLWESLETDSSGILCLKMDWRVLIVNVEITAFLKVVHAAAPDTDALVGLYTREAGRLNARLPLMQKITRREFLKYRLESLAKTRAPEQVQLLLYIKSLLSTQPTEERDKLAQELHSISVQLSRDLPEYERTYLQTIPYCR